jgi:hypothetical protein
MELPRPGVEDRPPHWRGAASSTLLIGVPVVSV